MNLSVVRLNEDLFFVSISEMVSSGVDMFIEVVVTAVVVSSTAFEDAASLSYTVGEQSGWMIDTLAFVVIGVETSCAVTVSSRVDLTRWAVTMIALELESISIPRLPKKAFLSD